MPLVALMLAFVVVGNSVGVARQPPSNASRCDRPFSSTLSETGKVRIYALRKETGHPAHRHPAIGGRPIFGCLKQTGRSLLLNLPEVDDESHAIWVEVGSQALATKGPLVAYSYTEYYFDTHGTWVRVRDLRSGAVIRTCHVGGGLDPGRRPLVTDIALNSKGEVWWNEEGGAQPPTGEAGCTPRTYQRLYSGV